MEARRAFETIGIDIFGPIYDGPRSKGRRKKNKVLANKYYGLLFVCAASRAVHIELIHSRSSLSVLRALHRFFSRRGVPERIYSDNEKAFRKNKEVLYVYYNLRWCQKYLSRTECAQNLVWVFNPPESPWFGGFYERLVGTVKRGLFGFKPQRQYYVDELQTLLALIEAIVNSRPLMSHSATEPAITPSHLVLGHGLLHLPPLPAGPPCNVSKADEVLINYGGLLKKLNRFWRVWQTDYLSSLREYHLTNTREPRIGELVIVQTRSTPRGEWPMGVVKGQTKGADGITRLVDVWFPKTNKTEPRTARLLVPLEASRITVS